MFVSILTHSLAFGAGYVFVCVLIWRSRRHARKARAPAPIEGPRVVTLRGGPLDGVEETLKIPKLGEPNALVMCFGNNGERASYIRNDITEEYEYADPDESTE